ncbi:hypothetical protein BSNK01_13500 [Bacillaceae bacterium]
MIITICTLLAAYIAYRQGVRQLFRSKFIDEGASDWPAYALFMLSGLLLGDLIALSLLQEFGETSQLVQSVSGSLLSIFIGESFYHRNLRLLRKIACPKNK